MNKYFEGLSDITNYVEEHQEPVITEIDGHKYTNKSLHRVTKPEREALSVSSLSALVNYIHSNVDAHKGAFIVVIDNVLKVSVWEAIDVATKQRELLIVARGDHYSPEFGSYKELDRFIIELRSRFVPTDHSSLVLSALGNLKKDESIHVNDDGITQRVTAKQGVSYETETLPNPVTLKPFRTFAEIEQPESEFVLRINDGLRALLEEADGGVWKLVAMKRITEFLEEALSDEIAEGNVVILA